LETDTLFIAAMNPQGWQVLVDRVCVYACMRVCVYACMSLCLCVCYLCGMWCATSYYTKNKSYHDSLFITGNVRIRMMIIYQYT
jgi:hypothetical protein